MKITFLFLFLTFSLRSFACMNEYNIIPGIERVPYSGYQLYMTRVYKPDVQHYVSEKVVQCKVMDKTCSDLVIAWLYLEEFEKALELSSKLVKKYPKEYEILMTHAAALELNGKPAEAIKFIKKGMKIDPESHHGSEWIHLRILEDQISGTHENILGFDFGDGEDPILPEGVNARQLMTQLNYQLTERYYFIPYTDKQFASLLHDYADLCYLSNYKTISQDYYREAKNYGYKNSPRKKYGEPEYFKERLDTPENYAHYLRAQKRQYNQQREKDRNSVLISFIAMLSLIVPAKLLSRRGEKY